MAKNVMTWHFEPSIDRTGLRLQHECNSRALNCRMGLWRAVKQALESQGTTAVQDGDAAYSGPQLLQLVSVMQLHCSEMPVRRPTPDISRLPPVVPPPPLLQAAAAARLLQASVRLQDLSTSTRAPADAPPPCGIYLTSSAAYVVAALACLQLG